MIDLQLAQQIRTVTDRNPRTLADFKRFQRAVDHHIILFQHLCRHAEFGRAFLHGVIGHQIGDQEHAFFGHQFGCGLVDQIAVFDGAHTGMGGAGNGFGRIGMGADIAAEGMGLFHCRTGFFHAELQAGQRIIGRGDTARHHDLDLVGTLPHLFARRTAHLGDTIRHIHSIGHGVAAMAAQAVIGSAARVRMPACRADRLTGNKQARAGHIMAIHRLLDPPIGTAGITHAGKAAVDHALHQ